MTKKKDDKQKKKGDSEGAIMNHSLNVVGKSYGGSPRALTQSVGLADPETSKPLRLPTVLSTPRASDALYAWVVSSDLSNYCPLHRGRRVII